jgi:hypothetical protein
MMLMRLRTRSDSTKLTSVDDPLLERRRERGGDIQRRAFCALFGIVRMSWFYLATWPNNLIEVSTAREPMHLNRRKFLKVHG